MKAPSVAHENHSRHSVHAPRSGRPPRRGRSAGARTDTRGHDVRVLTTDLFADRDRAWTMAEQRPYALDVFPAIAGNHYGFSTRFWKEIRRCVRNSDVVHVHTLWTFASLAAARACLDARIPFVVMPHGMLDPHSIRSGWLKKQAYGRALEWPLLRRARGICYTHVEEQRLATVTCQRLPNGYIVELGAESPPECERSELRAEFLERYPELLGRTTVLFLGACTRKKDSIC